jgi:Family of unknown function (DUF6404)
MNQYFEARRASAVRLLAKKGVPRWKSVPATYRFAWSCGIKLRPPHFASWEANFFLFGGTIAALVTIGTWLVITAAGRETALLQSLAGGVTVGVICGFGEAARYKREAEDHGLPRWDDLPDVAEAFD